MSTRAIHNDDEHRAALARIEALWEAAPGTDEFAEFEVLSILVDDYERRAFPIEAPSAVDAIRFRMEQAGLDRRALQRLLGIGSGRAAEILSGKRALTVEMIQTLHRAWGIPFESLVQPRPRLARGRRRSPRTLPSEQSPAAE